MNWYQPIECDNTGKNPLIVCEKNFEEYGFDYWDFVKGEKIDNWNENIIFQTEEPLDEGEPDDALQSSPLIPIYSKRLVNKLNENEISGIQYLPVKILNFKGESVGEFFIANFLNFVSALNYEKSIYSLFSKDFSNIKVRGKISGVRKYVLDKEKIEKYDVIRLKDYEQRFFVSEKFVDIFKKNKFTGYSFKKIELI